MTKEQELFEFCKKFVEEQDITCPETIHQSDRVIENAYEFIEHICDIVGYVAVDEDDE